MAGHRKFAPSRLAAAALSGKFKFSFSQYGEDIVIRRQFPHGVAGFYVDIGAFHPYRFSNTAMLWIAGWNGVNIDANPATVAAFQRVRPADRNVHAAVVPAAMARAGREVFFSADRAAPDPRGHVSAEGGSRVPALTLDDIAGMVGERRIDFLNIDIEGLDEALVADDAFARLSPTLLAMEIRDASIDDIVGRESVARLRALGYAFIAHIGITSLFRRKP